MLLAIALSTLVSEDLACIAAGLLIAQGKISWPGGVLACLVGIFAGDLMLFLAGRFAGIPARRWFSAASLDKAGLWIRERGLAVVVLSRFTPGLRLPTYFVAGVLRLRFWGFAAQLLLACTLWTPLLVGGTALFGEQAFAHGLKALPLAGLAAWAALWLARRAASWKRLWHWEFWPMWAAYLPLAPYLLYLAIRYRSVTLFTAANPGIESGGFVGESKAAILGHLAGHESAVPFKLVDRDADAALAFANRVGYPIVLKPDQGERGNGVAIARTAPEVRSYMARATAPTIAQQYVPGHEFGVFYVRYPDQPCGRIVSITEKQFPVVVGDGESTVDQLVVGDPRASIIADVYRKSDRVPARGEHVQLVEIGSHCRGTIFLDACSLVTPELERAIDEAAKAHPGFHFGRFDVRAKSTEALRDGRFHVLELNGVSSEATHIYDSAVSLWDAYRVMFAQWRVAFEIGAANHARGFAPMRLRDLVRRIFR